MPVVSLLTDADRFRLDDVHLDARVGRAARRASGAGKVGCEDNRRPGDEASCEPWGDSSGVVRTRPPECAPGRWASQGGEILPRSAAPCWYAVVRFPHGPPPTYRRKSKGSNSANSCRNTGMTWGSATWRKTCGMPAVCNRPAKALAPPKDILRPTAHPDESVVPCNSLRVGQGLAKAVTDKRHITAVSGTAIGREGDAPGAGARWYASPA
jgi:hypothetical protein